MTHDFGRSLAVSRAQANLPLWREVYDQAFGPNPAMAYVANDGWAQRGGIDRIVTCASGKTLSIDEKVRTIDYGDILLEVWSSVEDRIPGWVAKDLACDFVAYAILPTNTCYLLPFAMLRRAWKQNRIRWWASGRRISADNGRYHTISLAMPTSEVMSAISAAAVVRFGREQNHGLGP